MTQQKSQYRQVTCLSRLGLAKREVEIPFDTRADIQPGETIQLCDIEGPGRIVRFWMTLPVFGRGSILRDAVLMIGRAKDLVFREILVLVADTFYSDPFEQLDENRWGDFIGHYFRCSGCGRIFELAADTYHGGGGAWCQVATVPRDVRTR